MHEHLDALEERMQQLQQAMRRAQLARDTGQLKELRAELRRAQRAWDALFEQTEAATLPPAALRPQAKATEQPAILPAREKVHQVLTLLNVPAAPKLIGTVHEAFFADALPPSRLTSLRRDEERSYRSAPGARPYYLCPALTHDLLSPARALLTISTWRLEDRIVGPLSARVHFLTGAINISHAAERLDPTTLPLTTRQLLNRYAQNIPGAQPPHHTPHAPTDLTRLRRAAEDELTLHLDSDIATRAEAAIRARQRLDDAALLFGGPFQDARHLQAVT